MSKDNHKKEELTQEATQDTVADIIPEIDYELVTSGPLYFDPNHIKPGYVPAFVADRPGEVEKYKKLGYTVVVDEINVGDNVASKSSRFGSAVTVQSKCGATLVLMAIRKELHDRLQAHIEKKNAQRTAGLGHIDGVPEEYQQFNGKALGEYKITRS